MPGYAKDGAKEDSEGYIDSEDKIPGCQCQSLHCRNNLSHTRSGEFILSWSLFFHLPVSSSIIQQSPYFYVLQRVAKKNVVFAWLYSVAKISE